MFEYNKGDPKNLRGRALVYMNEDPEAKPRLLTAAYLAGADQPQLARLLTSYLTIDTDSEVAAALQSGQPAKTSWGVYRAHRRFDPLVFDPTLLDGDIIEVPFVRESKEKGQHYLLHSATVSYLILWRDQQSTDPAAAFDAAYTSYLAAVKKGTSSLRPLHRFSSVLDLWMLAGIAKTADPYRTHALGIVGDLARARLKGDYETAALRANELKKAFSSSYAPDATSL